MADANAQSSNATTSVDAAATSHADNPQEVKMEKDDDEASNAAAAQELLQTRLEQFSSSSSAAPAVAPPSDPSSSTAAPEHPEIVKHRQACKEILQLYERAGYPTESISLPPPPVIFQIPKPRPVSQRLFPSRLMVVSHLVSGLSQSVSNSSLPFSFSPPLSLAIPSK